jgi:hypothetical protein
MTKDLRRHSRRSLPGMIRISWQDTRGQDKFATGRMFDVSESGVRLEVPEPIAPQTRVNVRCEKLNLAGSGLVRHCTRNGAKYIIGVALSSQLFLRPEPAETAPGGGA